MRNRITETMSLNHGHSKAVGYLEKLSMIKAGKHDGINGLPKNSGEGKWTSAVLQREVHSCQEYCDKMWGKLQINMEKTYAEIDRLKDVILKNKTDIIRLDNEVSIKEENIDLSMRKSGEEDLSDSVVASRRQKELNKETAETTGRIRLLKTKNEQLYNELYKLRGIVAEATTTTKLMTHKIEEHSRQKIDIYWNAAYEVHPDKDHMPPIADVNLKSNGEETFVLKHSNTDNALIAILSGFKDMQNNNNQEVAQ